MTCESYELETPKCAPRMMVSRWIWAYLPAGFSNLYHQKAAGTGLSRYIPWSLPSTSDTLLPGLQPPGQVADVRTEVAVRFGPTIYQAWELWAEGWGWKAVPEGHFHAYV